MINVIIADDVQIIRSGLRAVLGGDSGIRVVGEATDGKRRMSWRYGCARMWCSWICGCRILTADTARSR